MQQIILWNCFALSFMCLVFTYVMQTKKSKITRVDNFHVSVIKNLPAPIIKGKLKAKKLYKKTNLVHAVKATFFLFVKPIEIAGAISNLAFTKSYTGNGALGEMLADTRIAINCGKFNTEAGATFVYKNCAYYHAVLGNLLVVCKTVLKPLKNIIISQIKLKNMGCTVLPVSVVNKNILKQVGYITKYNAPEHEVRFEDVNNYVLNKTIGAAPKYNQYNSYVTREHRIEEMLTHYEINKESEIVLYVATSVNTPLPKEVADMQEVFVLNKNWYALHGKELYYKKEKEPFLPLRPEIDSVKKVPGWKGIQVETKEAYINKLINNYLPKKVIKEFYKSPHATVPQFLNNINITFLKNYNYNYVIKLLFHSHCFAMLYKYLVRCVIGVQISGDIVKFFKCSNNLGKMNITINGHNILKINSFKNNYFVYNNIIYYNEGTIRLKRVQKELSNNEQMFD